MKSSDPENPPLTREEFARMKPFPGDLPTPLAGAIRRNHEVAQARRRKPAKPTKAVLTIRISRDALARYRASGRGWQRRLAAIIEREAPTPVPRRRRKLTPRGTQQYRSD
jgi:uncharacterized protein (DUF4415 family)